MIKNVTKKAFLLFFSIVFVLLVAEAVLYVSGKIYYATRIRNRITEKRDKNIIRVLCLGDSNTFGMGAERGYSYPEQLERLLNREKPGGKQFIVYNAGVPGNTSSKVLNHLEEDLETYKPDIAVLLIGTNDPGCIEETNYLFCNDVGFRGLVFRLGYYLSGFRVYKLCKRGWDIVMVQVWKMRLRCEYASLRALKSMRLHEGQPLPRDEKIEKDFNEHYKRGAACWNAHTRNDTVAIEEFKQAIALKPDTIEGYIWLAEVYMASDNAANIGLAIDTFKIGLRIDPFNEQIWQLLWLSYYRIGETVLAYEALKKYLYLHPQDIPTYLPFLKYGLPSIGDEIIFDKVLRFNVKKIIACARSRKIKIILQNYPFENWSSGVKEIALKQNVPFVDNSLEFKKLELQAGYKYVDYFNPDTHCTDKGYAVMAQNVYSVIKGL